MPPGNSDPLPALHTAGASIPASAVIVNAEPALRQAGRHSADLSGLHAQR
jgi:hypothetical protein